MSAGAANLVNHVLPDVPIRQFVATMPLLLRFPLAFDGELLGQVLRIFTDTLSRIAQKPASIRLGTWCNGGCIPPRCGAS
jgi:hypothetical protein